MFVYDAIDYREFIAASMSDTEGRAWGSVKQLAAALKCHSTYVSQILKGRADLSTEQAVALCRHFKLDVDSSEFFLDLVNRDKAGTEETRGHFQARIDRRLEDRQDLKKRLKHAESLTPEQESVYYNGWLPQVVHIYCQLPGQHSVRSIASALRVDTAKIESVLGDLATIGLVEKAQQYFRSTKDSVHLAKDSSAIARFHTNWRHKTISDMMTAPRLPGMHYSSVVSMSAADAQRLSEVILRHVETTREVILPSPSEHIYVYCLDFYKLAP